MNQVGPGPTQAFATTRKLRLEPLMLGGHLRAEVGSAVNLKFTMIAQPDAYCHEVGQMAQRNFSASMRMDEKVLRLSRPSQHDTGAKALDLVYQAADVFRDIEERAQEFKVRAEAAEQAQRELIVNAERRLQDVLTALEEANSRLATQQDQLIGVEYRA